MSDSKFKNCDFCGTGILYSGSTPPPICVRCETIEKFNKELPEGPMTDAQIQSLMKAGINKLFIQLSNSISFFPKTRQSQMALLALIDAQTAVLKAVDERFARREPEAASLENIS